MTTTGQDFTTYAGDAGQPKFTVRDASGNVIDISGVLEIEWQAGRDYRSTPVYTRLKSLGQIAFDGTVGVDGVFVLKIGDGDTTALRGFYVHSAVITDVDGNISTVELGRWQVGAATPAATYSGDPQLSDRDNVRFLVGDTDMTKPMLFDAEIDSLLVKWQPALYAAAQAARSIAASFARRVTKRVGDLSINYGQLSQQFYALAQELQGQAETFGAVPYSGGISRADKRAVNENTDREKPPFRYKQFDNRSGVNNTSEFFDQFGDGESDGS